MSYTFTERVPNFIDFGPERVTFEFETIQELMNHSHLKYWINLAMYEFYKFSLDTDSEYTTSKRDVLIAEYNNGEIFYGIGYISKGFTGLPEWFRK